MKLYLAGKITGNPNYRSQFDEVAKVLATEGHTIMYSTNLPAGYTHDEYLHICFAMIDVCEGIALLPNWKESRGAQMEHAYAIMKDKKIFILNHQNKVATQLIRR